MSGGLRLYAVGDIHGRADLLAAMHGLIGADSVGGGGRRAVVYLGDYIDRGPRSCAVIEMLVAEPLEGFQAVHLKGNHEDLLIQFLDGPSPGDTWLANGGMATLESYGIDFSVAAAAGDYPESLRQDLLGALPASHLDFLRALKPFHAVGDYFFAHAGVRPGVPLEEQDEFDLMWIRGAFLAWRDDFSKMVVHGHSIVFDPQVRPNRIGIDTGAYRTGTLTCLVLEGEERRFLQT